MNQSKQWDERKFKQWLKYREDLVAAKRNKNWNNVILVCDQIFELDQEAKFINILTPIIRKEKCKALGKSQRYEEAIQEYRMVIDGLEFFRNSEPLSSPTDWLDEIDRAKKEISRLSKHQLKAALE